MTRIAAAMAVVGAALVVVAGASPMARSLQGEPPVAQVAGQLVDSGARSALVYVSRNGQAFEAASGPLGPRTQLERFRAASITKTFTAAVVLRLVDERRLRLDDKLARYLPGVVPKESRITVRQLLNHTSGLANYTEYRSWMAKAERSDTTRAIDALRFALTKRPVFTPPGSRWSYSNTNYIALGLLVEKLTKRSFAQALDRYVIGPLGLEDTELATERQLPDLQDVGINPNLSWAAGGLVSNARDLARFYSALLSGKLLSAASLTQMKRVVPLEGGGYGLGLGVGGLFCGKAWGHDGRVLNYGTRVSSSSNGRRVAVVVTRGTTFPEPDMGVLLCA